MLLPLSAFVGCVDLVGRSDTDPAHPQGTVDDAHTTYALFVLMVQDFSWPGVSADVLAELLDVHERFGVPVDVSVTTTQVGLLTRDAPVLWHRLTTSPWVTVNYHARPPTPYVGGFDVLGLAGMDEHDRRVALVVTESHTLDLTTGLPGDEPGGLLHLADLLGAPPLVMGAGVAPALEADMDALLGDVGVPFVVDHGEGAHALGDTRNGRWIRPEARAVRLADHVGEDPDALLDEAYAEACDAIAPPCVVALKIHDNDFFAEASAWATVYGRDPLAPYDTSPHAALLPADERAAMLAHYRAVVAAVAARRDDVPPIGAGALADALP